MRHPRRRHRKPVTHWVALASGRPSLSRVEEDGTIVLHVDKKYLAPWTPARGRSKHWIELRKSPHA